MAPMFAFYDYEAQFNHQKCTEAESVSLIPPRSELEQSQHSFETSTPERRHCSLCNVYFDTVSRLETHNSNTHSLEVQESLARENIKFTLRLRREYVGQLTQEIERAMEEEFELQERQNERERLLYEERLEKWRVHERPLGSEVRAVQEVRDQKAPVAKQSKGVQKSDSDSPRRLRDTDDGAGTQRKKGSSIEILAIIPGGRVKAVSPLPCMGERGPCPSASGCLCGPQSCYNDPAMTDRHCPICRTSFGTAGRYNKHKKKVHKDFAGDLARAWRERWEKVERQILLREERKERRRQGKANKSQRRGKRRGGTEPRQSILNNEGSEHCGCQITFGTWELFYSHVSKYRELGLSHGPALALPSQHVVVKPLARATGEETGSRWKKWPNETIKAGTFLPLKGLNRMQKRIRKQTKVQSEKCKKREKARAQTFKTRRQMRRKYEGIGADPEIEAADEEEARGIPRPPVALQKMASWRES